MATVTTPVLGNPAYPTTDGKPMAETDHHRKLATDLIQTLDIWFLPEPMVYVSGNLLIFYVPGNKRRHIAPDVFVVKGVRKGDRLNYILWEEGKGPDLAIELTSSSTRHKDTTRKYQLYQDVLKIQEYILFDPLGDYLDPPLRGYRLRGGKYAPIRPVHERLPSQVLGLHFEADGQDLRLYNPATGQRLRTVLEEAQRLPAVVQEAEQLRREVAELRRRLSQRP